MSGMMEAKDEVAFKRPRNRKELNGREPKKIPTLALYITNLMKAHAEMEELSDDDSPHWNLENDGGRRRGQNQRYTVNHGARFERGMNRYGRS